MKKRLIILTSICLFFGVASLTYSAPNIWRVQYSMGYADFSINDEMGRTLWIQCNIGLEEDIEHRVYYEEADIRTENSISPSHYPLRFVIDEEIEVLSTGSTKWRHGYNAWYEFTEAMARAKKIEVYIDHKKATHFTPPAANIKTIANQIKEACWP